MGLGSFPRPWPTGAQADETTSSSRSSLGALVRSNPTARANTAHSKDPVPTAKKDLLEKYEEIKDLPSPHYSSSEDEDDDEIDQEMSDSESENEQEPGLEFDSDEADSDESESDSDE